MEKKSNKRTLPQNRLYWKWLTELAKELVDHGVDMRELIEVPIMATPERLHDQACKPLMEAMFNKDSSTKLTTVEIGELADKITDVFAQRTDGEVMVRFDPDADLPDWYKDF